MIETVLGPFGGWLALRTVAFASVPVNAFRKVVLLSEFGSPEHVYAIFVTDALTFPTLTLPKNDLLIEILTVPVAIPGWVCGLGPLHPPGTAPVLAWPC